MRNDELIINGTAVDLGSTNVPLEYVNNIISSVDKINASHSYTLTLPRTAKNERVFDFAGDVSHVSEKVGVYLDASYRRSGLTIVNNAKCYVSGVTENAFEVCLLWDGLARFTEWKKENPTLNDIEYPTFVWDGVHTSYLDYYEDVVQAVYNTGVDESVLPAPPCVNAFGLLSKIMENIVDTWRMPNAKQSELSRLFIPLCKRGGTRAETAGGVWGLLDYVSGGYLDLRERSFGTMSYSASQSGFSTKAFTKVNIIYDFEFGQSFASGMGGTPKLYILAKASSTSTPVLLHTTVATTTSSNKYRINDNVEFDVSSYECVYFTIGYVQNNFGCRGFFKVAPTTKEAVLGDIFDIGVNMPNISQVDYIKAVCAMFGCQVVNNSDGTLSFVSVDDVIARKGEALNWTTKVVNYRNTPTKVSFTLGEYAQRNWLRYKEDDDRKSEAFFDVRNVSLAQEKDVATLPFAVTKNDEILHYSVKDDVVSDVNVTPRILRCYETDDGELGVRWENSLNMDALLSSYYGGLRSLLEYAVQIRAYMRLDERDLATLEWTRPVYLAQTGKYYIVAKIATDASSDISDVTLYQL